MDIMTTTDYLIEDDYSNAYEQNKPQALIEFYEKIEPEKQKFEHFLNDTAVCDTPYMVFQLFTTSVTLMKMMAKYDFYDEDANIIEYNFTKELKMILLDEYGWEI